MKLTLSAVIPTHQYANLQPTVEVEAESFDEAYATGMQQIRKIWNDNVEAGKELTVVSDKGQLLQGIGGSIYYDDATHTYTNEKGEVYLSGSQYAGQFEKPFNAEFISEALVKKVDGVTAQEVLDMWELKKNVSASFGTAIHGAIELCERFRAPSEALDKLYHIHDHPVLKNAVDGFLEAHKDETVKSEVLVVSHQRKWAGRIDRLLFTGDKKVRVQDFKTNAVLDKKKLEVYWKQLNFYGTILSDAGYSVDGLDIFHYDGSWHEFNEEFTPISEDV